MKLTKKQTEYYDKIFAHNGKVRTTNGYEEFAYFGGFGSGKSFIVMLATYQICLMYPSTPWLYVRETYPELNDSVIPQFNALFNYNGYEYFKAEREARFSNGSVISFRAFDRDTKILSNEYAGASFCQAEDIPEELFLQTLGRLRHRRSGLPKNIRLIEGNPSNTWVKRRYKDEKPIDVWVTETTTYDNPYLPKEYVETLIKNYPDNWVNRYVYGEWENFDEMVFPEFKEKQIVIMPILQMPKHFKKAVGGDYGYRNPSAWIWGAIDYDGNIIVNDEWYQKEMTPDEIAKAYMKHGRLAAPYDYSTKRPDRDGKSVWTELEKNGVLLIPSNKDEMKNITTINMLMKQGRLKITSNCVNLIKELKGYKWKKMKLGEEKNFPEQTIDKDNHAIDAMCYLVNYLEDLKSSDPTRQRPENMIRHYVEKYDTISIDHLG